MPTQAAYISVTAIGIAGSVASPMNATAIGSARRKTTAPETR
jgi:hypothetical protein